jgi:uncharacterized protein
VLLAVAVAALAAAGCSASSVPRPSAGAHAPASSPGATPRASLVAASSPGSATAPISTGPTITATGEGTASGAPDLLTVTLGVQTNGPTAHGVLETNNAEAAALIDKLKADGVAADDIQTTQLSLNPVYDESDHLTGYQATDTVTVRAHQRDRAGSVIDDAVTAGGADSQVQSIEFSVADDGPLLAAAHADAVRQAVAEAKAMAAAAGVSLGALESVTDTSAPQVTPFVTAGAAARASGAPPAVPVQPGTEQVTADVTVAYAVG